MSTERDASKLLYFALLFLVYTAIQTVDFYYYTYFGYILIDNPYQTATIFFDITIPAWLLSNGLVNITIAFYVLIIYMLVDPSVVPPNRLFILFFPQQKDIVMYAMLHIGLIWTFVGWACFSTILSISVTTENEFVVRFVHTFITILVIKLLFQSIIYTAFCLFDCFRQTELEREMEIV